MLIWTKSQSPSEEGLLFFTRIDKKRLPLYDG